MTEERPFSVRSGINPEPHPTPEAAPEELRYFLLKHLKEEYRDSPFGAAEIIAEFLRSPGLSRPFRNPYDPSTWERLYKIILEFEWWKVYDFIEFIYNTSAVPGKHEFILRLNNLFSEQNICYRINREGKIIYSGSETFTTTVERAESALEATGRLTAKNEIHKALEDLSKRPTPDLTGAVQHAMAALECVARDVCGESSETLGAIIKKHPDKFPPP